MYVCVQYGIIPHLRMSQHLQIIFKPTPSLTFTVAKFVQPIINRNGPEPPPPSCGETHGCVLKPCEPPARTVLGIHGRLQHFWASLTHASFLDAFDISMAKNAVRERGRNANEMLSM